MTKDDVAFYFPGPLWTDAGAIKNLLLFFDRIALLVPAGFKDTLFEHDRTLAPALLERGALDIIEPRDVLDEEIASLLHPLITEFADSMPASPTSSYRYISWTRLGGHVAEQATKDLIEQLRHRGLAGRESDSSVEIDGLLWAFTLTALSYLLSDTITGHGLLVPATDLSLPFLATEASLAGIDPAHQFAELVTSDIEAVSVDLDGVLVEDILAFRDEHRADLLSWRSELTDTVADAASLGPLLGQSLLDQRSQELRTASQSLRSRIRLDLDLTQARTVGFAASAVAFGSGIATGEPVVGTVASAVSLLSSVVHRKVDGSPIPSYLVRARGNKWTHEDEYSLDQAAESGSGFARKIASWSRSE